MILKNFLKIKALMILVLIPILVTTNLNDAVAKKKSGKSKKSKHSKVARSYNPTATKALAIETIKNNSQSISELAGLSSNVAIQDNLAYQQPAENFSIDNNVVGDNGEDIAELEQEDDVIVDIETFRLLWMQYVDEDNKTLACGVKKEEIMNRIMNWLGTPYRFGGMTNRAIDCSAWTQRVYAESAKLLLPRTAREQFEVGKLIKRKGLEFGDLVFFHTYSMRFPSHVGIYLGDNLFAHASSRFGVTVSSLESTYYNNRFIGGKRISLRDANRYTVNDENEEESEQ
eukprot:TRINITY_DN17810_c0_g1_i1.p1 TRINITY_DN17810_c0_g1~~TRINITY_DN17810_c0_g1_i1.p1  ORF type:complete len:286 (+),score=-12.43 TRINITY_DN17810_c0_g1_i1:164-1021(+)